ncbi:alpha/beta fold hydrolase [Winogradskyella flava]|uniref:alpha/beta fold hydrolase n=1 Tax=Winogradskyella flava TaxID=1884876 RepID=UPI00249168FD|nr:alpha/beta hydrolase [Winogradskyella flava]
MKTLKCLIFTFLISVTLSAQSTAFTVDIKGEGAPIFLFPGFTCPGEVWDDVVNELSKTNECHVFTFAGFGDVPAIEKPWLPKIKDEIVAYISENKLENITLIGHSLGGTLSLWLASENSESFKQVIAVDALPSTGALMIPNYDSDMIAYDTPYNKQMLSMSDQDFEVMASQMASGMVLNEEKKQVIKDWIINTNRETYVYGFTDLLKLDLRKDIAKIKIPVLLLAATKPYGEETVKMTYKDQYKKLENYQIKYAKDSAHFIMYDQPEWLLETIISGLN